MIAKTSHIASFLSFLRELCRSASSIVVSPRYTDFYRPVRCISDLTIRAPRQLKPMATSVRVSCVFARTNNYLWHDCQLNIVPAPNIARLASPSPYISLFPSLSPLAPGVQGVWLRQATAATCVAEQTVFIHPRHTTLGLFTPCFSHPLSILLPPSPPRLLLFSSLSLSPLLYSNCPPNRATRYTRALTSRCRLARTTVGATACNFPPSTFFPIWFKVPVENYMCVKECVCVSR